MKIEEVTSASKREPSLLNIGATILARPVRARSSSALSHRGSPTGVKPGLPFRMISSALAPNMAHAAGLA